MNKSGSGKVDIGDFGSGDWETLDITGVFGSIIWNEKVLFHARIYNGVSYDVDVEIEVRFDSDDNDFFDAIAKFPILKVKADGGSKTNSFNVTSSRIDGIQSDMSYGRVQLALRHRSQTTPWVALMCGPDDYIRVPFTPQYPRARAGNDRTVTVNDTISFDASSSYDPNGDDISYKWDFDLSDGLDWDSTEAVSSHVFNVSGTYTVTLNVSDSTYHSYDTVHVEVIEEMPPVARAGDDLTVQRSEIITLNGTLSSDPNGDTLTYHWDFGDESDAEGSVVSHSYDEPGEYIVNLTVSDALFESSDELTVTVMYNQPPVARINMIGKIGLGVSLTFSGVDSYDPEGEKIVSFTWDFGNGTELNGSVVSHKFDTPGNKTVKLLVSDGEDEGLAYLNISIPENQPPIANAGVDFEQYTGKKINFDGSGSADPEGLELTYYWDFGDGSEGMGKTAEYSYTKEGSFKVLLRVTDPFGGSDTDIINATIYDSIIFKPETVEISENYSSQDGVKQGSFNTEWNYDDPDNPREVVKPYGGMRFYMLEPFPDYIYNISVEVSGQQKIDFLLLDADNYNKYIGDFEKGKSEFINTIDNGTILDADSIVFQYNGSGRVYFVVDNNAKIFGGAEPVGRVYYNVTILMWENSKGSGEVIDPKNDDPKGESGKESRSLDAILLDLGFYSLFVIQVLVIFGVIAFVVYRLVNDRKKKVEPALLSQPYNFGASSGSKTDTEVYKDIRYNLGALIFTPIFILLLGLVGLIIAVAGLTWEAIFLMIIVDMGIIMMFLYFRRIITINSTQLSIIYGAGIKQINLPLDKIRSYDLLKASFHERYRRRRYYSWRLKTNAPGFKFIFRSDGLETLVIRMNNGKKYNIWTDEAPEFIRGMKEGKGAYYVGNIEVEVREGARLGLR